MASIKDKLSRSLSSVLSKTDWDERATQYFRPKTGTLATKGRKILLPALKSTASAIDRSALGVPAKQTANFMRTPQWQQNPLNQFSSGIAAGSNFGLTPIQPAPQTFGGKIAYGTGSMLGALNPYGATGRTIRGVVGLTNPYIAKAISPFAKTATAPLISRGVSALGNVAQGVAIDRTTGQPTTPLSVGFDVLTGAAFGPTQFGGGIKAGLKSVPDVRIQDFEVQDIFTLKKYTSGRRKLDIESEDVVWKEVDRIWNLVKNQLGEPVQAGRLSSRQKLDNLYKWAQQNAEYRSPKKYTSVGIADDMSIKSGLEDRLKSIRDPRKMSKNDFMKYGQQQFAENFDNKKWSDIYDSVYSKVGDYEFNKRFNESIARNPVGTKQGAKNVMLDVRGDTAGGIRPTAPGDVDYRPNLKNIQQDVADMRARGVPEEEIKAAVKAYKEPPLEIPSKYKAGFKPEIKAQGKRVRILSNEEFQSISTKPRQVGYSKKVQQTMHGFFDDMERRLKTKGINQSDFIDDIQSGGTKYHEMVKLHQRAVERMADFIKQSDPDWNGRDFYYPHMKPGAGADDIMKQVEDGIWISQADIEAGNILHSRTKNVTDYSRNYGDVMKRYSDQFIANQYLKNLKPETPLQKGVLDYSRQVKEVIADETKKVSDIDMPDFVSTGAKKAGKVVKYKLGGIGSEGRTNDNIFKNIGGEVNAAWRKYRDITTRFQYDKKGTPIYNKPMKDKAIQNFIETATSHKYSDGVTQQYVNDTIAGITTIRQYERNLEDTVTNAVTDMFTMAHLGLSFKTGMLQLLEMTRIPAVFKTGDIGKGLKNINPKALTKKYALWEFDNPYDIKRMTGELEGAGIKNAYNKFKDAIFFPMIKGEKYKNVVYAAVAEEAGKAKGLKGEALTSFVRDKLFRYANVANKNNRAKIFSRNWGRLAFMYSQYNMKSAQEVFDNVANKNTGKAMKLMGSHLFNIAVISAITGIPLKYAITQLSPLGIGPILTTPKRMLEDYFTGRGSDESKKQKLQRTAVQNVVPMGTQGIRTTEGLKASKGYDVAPAGGVRYYGEPEGTFNKIKAAVFGKQSLPGVKQYYKEDRQVLGETQTKAFMELGPEYAETIMAKRKDDRAVNEAKERVKEGGSEIVNNELIYWDAKKQETRVINLDRAGNIPELPKLGDNEDINKETISRYKSELSDIENDVYDLMQQKQITRSMAEKQLKELNTYKELAGVDILRLQKPIAPPKMTGSKQLDKEAVSRFKSQLTSMENDVFDLWKLGVLSQDDAEKKMVEIEAYRNFVSKSGSGKKLPKMVSDAQLMSAYKKAMEAAYMPKNYTFDRKFSTELASIRKRFNVKRQALPNIKVSL